MTAVTMKPLAELVDFLDNLRRPVKSDERRKGPYPYYGANGQQGTIDGYLFDEPLVLLAEDGGHFDNPRRGIAYRVTGKVWVNNHAHVLRAREGVDVDYLCRALENRDVTQYLTGSTRAKLTKGSAARIPVPLPPIEEQKRIAAVLDEVDTLRTKRCKALTILNDLAQSVFLDMFGDPVHNTRGWERLPMSDLLETIDSGVSPQCLDRSVEDGEWGVLKLGAVTQCVYQQEENKALPDGVEPQPRHEVRVGDLLLSRKNTPALVGAAAYVRHTRARLLLPDLIFRLVLKQGAPIDGVYLHALLTHPGKRRVVQSLASGSAASMVNISKQKLLGLLCEIPPLNLQSAFSRRMAAVEKEREVHAVHLSALDSLFTSLQQRAFSGTLWDHEAAA